MIRRDPHVGGDEFRIVEREGSCRVGPDLAQRRVDALPAVAMHSAQLLGRNQDVPALVVGQRSGRRRCIQTCASARASRPVRPGLARPTRACGLHLTDPKAAARPSGAPPSLRYRAQLTNHHPTAIVDQHVEQAVAAIKREHPAAEGTDGVWEARVRAQVGDCCRGHGPAGREQGGELPKSAASLIAVNLAEIRPIFSMLRPVFSNCPIFSTALI